MAVLSFDLECMGYVKLSLSDRLHSGWWQDQGTHDETHNAERVQQRSRGQSCTHGGWGEIIIKNTVYQ